MGRAFILYLCSLTLRSLILAGVAGLFTFRIRNVAARHAVWTIVLACTLLMPVADALLPATLVPAVVPQIVRPMQTFVVLAPQAVVETARPPAAPAKAPGRDWWGVASYLLVLVSAILLCRTVLASHEIRRIRRRSRAISNIPSHESETRVRAVEIRESGAVAIPFTVGLIRPVLILPTEWREWDDWKFRAVLAHEETHVSRRDWGISAAAAGARCVFWFNPLLWWLERRLSSLAEQASDEACVRLMGDAPRYAETLLEFAAMAKHGHRWLGGVAMAKHRISFRIERVLALGRPGSGILSGTRWLGLVVLALPALYASAAAQAGANSPMLAVSPAELAGVFQVLPAPEPAPVVGVAQQSATPVRAIAVPATQGTVVLPVSPTPAAPQQAPVPTTVVKTVVNPDLVGEIRLILAPVNVSQEQGQVQLSIVNAWSRGNAVWNVRNTALDPATWAYSSGDGYAFALTGIQGRTLLFENERGTSSYGCPDCDFLVWESGMGSPTASAAPGIIFRVSNDGTSVTATCRASECRFSGVGRITALGNTGTPLATPPMVVLRESQVVRFEFPETNSTAGNLRCFSIFGNVKADGTAFTEADCPGGRVTLPSVMFFAVKK